MKRSTLIGALALGFVLGAVLTNVTPAAASGVPVVDIAAIAQAVKSFAQETGILNVLTAINTIQTTISSTMSEINRAIGGTTYGDTNTLLRQGFTQQANYAKAQTGAMEQIQDASNTVNAKFATELRDASIRDEHTLSPAACTALNTGQSITVAAGQAWRVSKAINDIDDRRGQGLPGTPAYAGAAQAAAAITQLHLSRYCSETEAQAGLCTSNPARENLDQDAASLFGTAAYDPNGGVDAANDFKTNLIQPITPASTRMDALTSVAGQDAEARRRSYNAKISLARNVVTDVIASRTNSVNLTADEKQQQVNQGLPQTNQSSWFGALELDVNRRAGSVEYAASLQAMLPSSLLREIATELAMSNYIALANLKTAQQNAAVNASLLATAADAELKPDGTMATPQMANQ